MERLCWDTDEETLRQTENAQLALFTTSLAAFYALQSGLTSDVTELSIGAVAGHSVGEFAALVASGVFRIEDAAKLVQARGETMAAAGLAQPGTMAAILGLNSEELLQICAEADGVVVVANDNCPGQVVISGSPEGVADAGSRATEAGAKKVIPLNVSGAFHSPLMNDAAAEMRPVFHSVGASDPTIRIYSNVTSEVAMEGFEWPVLLEMQLKSRVRWTESVQHMVRDGVDTFVECGVGDVLSGLIRRIDKSARCLKVNDSESMDATISALAGW
jgi:[acyl-carrier-protein] S-malonyltransferase